MWNPLMNFWVSFTETLSTAGGIMALLFVSTVLLGCAVIHVIHHGDTGTGATVIISAFSAFYGALLGALTVTARNKIANPPAPPPVPANPEKKVIPNAVHQ
jgi:hypothetical protein